MLNNKLIQLANTDIGKPIKEKCGKQLMGIQEWLNISFLATLIAVSPTLFELRPY